MRTILKQPWLAALAIVAIGASTWIVLFGLPVPGGTKTEPSYSPKVRDHLDHGPFFPKPFDDPRQVTRACLECHEDAASELMKTAHWSWLGEKVAVPGHGEEIRIGKQNLINNFCIGIQGNWASCTRCHAGYGWDSENFDFKDPNNVDCLVCHDWTGTYLKGNAGLPREGVDLSVVAKGVGYPKRDNCGVCHNYGGGGLGVKHGDLDNTLDHPSPMDDVHMGRHEMLCIDCHVTQEHQITGRSMSVSVEHRGGIACDDCHDKMPHKDERLNTHTSAVACETCHIPSFARSVATKMDWDWSKAGDGNRKDDIHRYLKIKGEFVYDSDVTPSYLWYNGTSKRYLLGDPMSTEGSTPINFPQGDINDRTAKIHPFKVHSARQPFDTKHRVLLQPVTSGEGGYWHEFDWKKALELGASVTGMEFSGSYDFAKTVMYWPLSHTVTPAKDALGCDDCHGELSRLNWEALGYDGDPVKFGGRQ